MEKIISKYWWIILIVLCMPAIWALFVPGFFGVSDDIHIAWLHQMDKIIREGQIPPRYVPDLSYGFGYPLFNFVFPLPFYLGEIFHLIGFSLVDSIKMVFGVSVIASALFMFVLLRNFLPYSLSLAGAVLYIYAPYRATDMYVRGAIGENLAFVFLPLIALSVIKLTEARVSNRWIGIGALSLAGLVLSHNITTYMFLPFILVLGLVRLLNLKNPKLIISPLAALLLGLLVSIYFWLPALLDSNLVKYDTVFNFVDHFPTLRQMITPYFGYGASVPGPYDWMSFYMGVTNILIVVLGTLFLLLRWKRLENEQRLIVLWAVISYLAVIFMMNYRSSFLWANLPFIGYFQFPWRFFIMTTFLTPLFLILIKNLKYNHLLAVLIIVVTIVLYGSYFKPQEFLGRDDQYFIERYIPIPTASEEYKKTGEEYLRLPKATTKRPETNFPRVFTQFPVSGYSVKEINSLNATIETDFGKTQTLYYNKYYIPGWEAEIDDRNLAIKPGSPYGQISFDVPAGKHQVEIRFKETPLKLFLNALSLAAFLGAVILIIKKNNDR